MSRNKAVPILNCRIHSIQGAAYLSGANHIRTVLDSNVQIHRYRLRILVASANNPMPTNIVEAGSGVAAAP